MTYPDINQLKGMIEATVLSEESESGNWVTEEMVERINNLHFGMIQPLGEDLATCALFALAFELGRTWERSLSMNEMLD